MRIRVDFIRQGIHMNGTLIRMWVFENFRDSILVSGSVAGLDGLTCL